MATVLLWAAAAWVAHTYIGYPLLLWLWTRRAQRPAPQALGAAELPHISVITAAHDEEAVIVDKLANCAAVDYPGEGCCCMGLQ